MLETLPQCQGNINGAMHSVVFYGILLFVAKCLKEAQGLVCVR